MPAGTNIRKRTLTLLIRKQFRAVSAQLDRVPKGRCRTIGFAFVGAASVLLGLILLVLPGPGLLFLALGLAVLSAEFSWARLLVRRIRQALVVGRRRYFRRSFTRI